MSKLPEISTKRGDSGMTSNYSNERLPKNSAQIKCIGKIDTFNASLGLFQDEYLPTVQEVLVRLMGEIATAEFNRSWYKGKITQEDIQSLEDECAKIKKRLEKEDYKIEGWVRYGGEGQISAFIDLSSKFCREAEIAIYDFEGIDNKISSEIKGYINRLSDYLYLLARNYREIS